MKKIFFAFIFLGFMFLGLFYNIFAQNSQPTILDIKAYLNDNEIEGPVYKNIYTSPVQDIDYLSSFVKVENIFHLLEAETLVNGKIINIAGETIGEINIIYENNTNIIIDYITRELELKSTFTNNSIVLINNEYYITISMVRYLIGGALKESEKMVILYTNDYERADMPLTLNDCYIAMNDLLSDEIKMDIKISSVDNLITYHMGLGMWIRNNWIRQTNRRITKLFLDGGVRHPDDMSQAIIIGYHYYLNGISKSIEELIKE
ncbi:MAG: hypothetical protein LBJ31_06340 [Treponema sp.]|jgi:hypothetical protein|nr:hypothetical protein [Treponema sp.]